jgi:AGZA family xanthine/uracil permease-like MFS transporter
MSWLENHFQLKTRGSSVSSELRAAVATFLTMAYILAANPAILKNAGVPFESAVACTAEWYLV